MLEKPTGTVLAFDFGEKRVGVATGEIALATAHPLTTIATEKNTERFDRIAALIAEWQPVQLVVGRPVHMDGTVHKITRLAESFAARLERSFHLPVAFADERLSSYDAESHFRHTRKKSAKTKAEKATIDALAAQIILQTWLENYHVQPQTT